MDLDDHDLVVLVWSSREWIEDKRLDNVSLIITLLSIIGVEQTTAAKRAHTHRASALLEQVEHARADPFSVVNTPSWMIKQGALFPMQQGHALVHPPPVSHWAGPRWTDDESSRSGHRVSAQCLTMWITIEWQLTHYRTMMLTIRAQQRPSWSRSVWTQLPNRLVTGPVRLSLSIVNHGLSREGRILLKIVF